MNMTQEHNPFGDELNHVNKDLIDYNREGNIVANFSRLLRAFSEFDAKQNEPYGILERIYKQAENIKNQEDASSDNLEIGIGNIKIIVDNFLENMPSDRIGKIEVIVSTDLPKLQERLKKEMDTRD